MRHLISPPTTLHMLCACLLNLYAPATATPLPLPLPHPCLRAPPPACCCPTLCRRARPQRTWWLWRVQCMRPWPPGLPLTAAHNLPRPLPPRPVLRTLAAAAARPGRRTDQLQRRPCRRGGPWPRWRPQAQGSHGGPCASAYWACRRCRCGGWYCSRLSRRAQRRCGLEQGSSCRAGGRVQGRAARAEDLPVGASPLACVTRPLIVPPPK